MASSASLATTTTTTAASSTSSSSNPPIAIADRTEIHKSCRALEAVVNVLSDYSEAARAVVSLQKKLAKALRDAAGLKATGEIAGYAFGSSAGVFEAMCEIDGKFAKIADKECDAVSGEVRKWFKKLAKEEKAHDDKIATVNARIKQAGMSYEKEAKKNSYDAVDEHTRYIALLSSLGPEITQEKYNHQLGVSQRNTAMTYGVAATVSRIADAEWQRATEGVRRFAPLIGQVGEWRALCEGGWTSALPEPLPDIDADQQQQQLAHQPATGTPLPPYIVPSDVLANLSPRPRPNANPASGVDRPDSFVSVSTSRSTGTDEARRPTLDHLASFPTPPTHFPLPPVHSPSKPSSPLAPPPTSDRQRASSPVKAVNGSGLPTPQSRSASSDGPPPAKSDEGAPRALPTAPVQDPPQTPTNGTSASPAPTAPSNSQRQSRDTVDSTPPPPASPTKLSHADADIDALPPPRALPPPTARANSYQSQPQAAAAASPFRRAADFGRGDYLDDREFAPPMPSQADKTRSLDSPVAGGKRSIASAATANVERTDTVRSAGSAPSPSSSSQIKDRYGRATGPGSPPPRDVPRLPMSVSEIASKFQSPSPVDAASPRRQQTAATPSAEEVSAAQVRDEGARRDDTARDRRAYDLSDATTSRSRDAPDSPVSASRRTFEYPADQTHQPQAPRPTSAYVDDLERRRQRLVELEELERRERDFEERAARRREEARGGGGVREDLSGSNTTNGVGGGGVSGGLARLKEEDERFDSLRRLPRPVSATPVGGEQDERRYVTRSPEPGMYADSRDGYRDSRDGYRDSRDGYRDSRDGYRDSRDGYRDPRDGYRDPRDVYRDTRDASYRDSYRETYAHPDAAPPPSRPYARPLSQASGTLQPPPLQSQSASLTSRYSYSTTSLAPSSPARSPSEQISQPFPSQAQAQGYSQGGRRSPLPSSPGGTGIPTHPGNCTCPACTVERGSLGPPQPSSTEAAGRERKVSGWRRRLSMPVIMPFAGGGDGGGGKKVEKGIMHMGGGSGGKGIGHQANSSVTSFGGRR